MKGKHLPCLSLLIGLVLWPSVVFAQVKIARPTRYVADQANVIDPRTEQSLNGILQELEQKTGAQYIVLTVDSLGGLPIEEFSIALVEAWKLGRAEQDDGLLFTLAMKERKARFEVGYGLEGDLTDLFCGRLIREVLAPLLRQGKISEGVYQANLRAIQKIAAAAYTVAARKGAMKLVLPRSDWARERHRGRALELYDLDADPAEERDLAPAQPREANALRAEIHAWLVETPAIPAGLGRGANPEYRRETQQNLRALGYLE